MRRRGRTPTRDVPRCLQRDCGQSLQGLVRRIDDDADGLESSDAEERLRVTGPEDHAPCGHLTEKAKLCKPELVLDRASICELVVHLSNGPHADLAEGRSGHETVGRSRVDQEVSAQLTATPPGLHDHRDTYRPHGRDESPALHA